MTMNKIYVYETIKEYERDALESAIEIAMQFHKCQKDMNGEPYILHPLRVMMKMGTFEEKVVGVLHDVLEDTECSIEYINARCEFSKDIVDALLAITRMSGEKYFEYVERLNKNSLARKVKVADLVDNLSRTGAPISLRKRYYKALGILCGEDNLPLM